MNVDEPSHTRKRARNVNQWKKNIDKANQNQKGEKTLGDNCSKCYLNCSGNFTQAERQAIMDMFYTKTYDEQQIYLFDHIIAKEKKQKLSKKDNTTLNRFNYYLDKPHQTVHVCGKFFKSTLAISKHRCHHIISQKRDGKIMAKSDGRGGSVKNISLDVQIVNHIKTYNSMQSHYSRTNVPHRQYLPAELSVAAMFRDFTQQNSNTSCIYNHYRNIFNSQFNISFKMPSTDTCPKCDQFKASNTTDSLI
jgi:hypothetical protein